METTSTGTINILESLDREDHFALQCALATVRDLMTGQLVTLSVDSTIRDATRLFSSGEFRQIPVLNGPYLVGMLSDRHVLRPRIGNLDPGKTPVSTIMIRNPTTIRPYASISEAIHLLTSKGIEYLPVTEESGFLHGIITKTDLLQVSLVVQRWLETRAPRVHG